MARKQSYADVTNERDIYKLRAHVMEIAYTETCDDTYRHRDGRDTYVWKAYRLTGHAGGYVVCVFDSFVNRRPAVFYIEHLDTAARQVRERYSSFADCGMCAAVDRFTVTRQRLLDAAA